MAAMIRTLLAALLFAAAALLPAEAGSALPLPKKHLYLAPADCPSQLPAEAPVPDGALAHCRYEKLPLDTTLKLQNACRDCVAVAFCPDCKNPSAEAESLVLKRGEGEPYGDTLAGLLRVMGVQSHIYTRTWEKGHAPAEPAALPRIRFLAADGSSLMDATFPAAGGIYTFHGHGPLSLWELCRRALPQPGIAPDDYALLKGASPEDPRVPCLSAWNWKLEDKPVYIDGEQTFCYIRMAPEDNARLRRALAACATVEVETLGRRGEVKRILRRTGGLHKGLADTLDGLAAVPQWLEESLYCNVRVTRSTWGYLRLLDAEGKLLWEGTGTSVACQPKPGGHPVSLYSFLKRYILIE